MPTISEINKILIELQEELEKVKTAAELVEIAKNTNETVLSESKSLFENEFQKIVETSKSLLTESKSLIEQTQKSSEVTLQEANKLSDSSNNLISVTNDLLNEIKKINFPSKLEKIDNTLSGLSTTIQNIFGRFDTFETSFKENLKNINEEINLKFTKIKNRTNGILILNLIVFVLFALIAYKMYF